MDRGILTTVDERPALRFERRYPWPVERVWGAVSHPAQLPRWFPSAVRYDEERTGTGISFSDDPNTDVADGTVLVFDPPHRFGFTWGDDELHLEVAATADGGARLTLVDVLAEEDTAARTAAGWSVCLAELGKFLGGEEDTGPHRPGAEPWRPWYDAYLAEGMPSGAPVPE